MFEWWNTIYSNHGALRTAVSFIHVGGLLAGGGCAITADLATITAARDSATAQLTELRVVERTHRVVAAGLAALFVSGILLLAADIDTYLHSRVFWVKMALVAVLLANGVRVLAAERRARRGEAPAWTQLHAAAVTSLLLWFLATLAGSALPNIG